MGLSLKMRGGTWYVTGTVMTQAGEKVRVRKSTGFGKGEEKYAREEMERVRFETIMRTPGKGGDATLADAIDLYVNRPSPPGRSDLETMRAWRRDMGAKRLKNLRTPEVMAWATKGDVTPGTVRRRMATMKACLNYARDNDLDVPDIKLRRPMVDDARDRWLTHEERDHLIACCDDEIRALVAFLFYTGARVGEALALDWRNVRDGEVVLSSRKGRGTVRRRVVPIHRTLQAMMPARTQIAGPVFTRGDGSAWDYQALWPKWNAALRRAGIEDFRMHDCRHTFASLLIQDGVRERVVADLLGHSSLLMVSRYTHLAPSHLRDALSALDRSGGLAWLA